jgi:hypothetical protein
LLGFMGIWLAYSVLQISLLNLIMVQLSGTYENGQVTLDKPIAVDKPVKVLVTFMDEDIQEEKRLTFDDFSFAKGREILKNLKSSLVDEIIEERRNGR